MAIESLGMIEVKGFLGAVVSADAALKASDVSLLDLEITRGGLVTVLLIGDVAAVNAAVDAGISSIENLKCLISHFVIARLDQQAERLTQYKHSHPVIKDIQSSSSFKKELEDKTVQENPENSNLNETLNNNIAKEPTKSLTPNSPSDDPQTWVSDRESLEKMRVVDLRKQAYKMNLSTLTKKQIKMGNKKTLIQAILDELKEGKDN